MSIDEVAGEIAPWASGHGGDVAAARQRQVVMAWERVARDARHLVTVCREAAVPTVLAYHSTTGRRRDRLSLPVWLLADYQPRHTQYLNTVDGRAFGTTTVAEVPGIALLPDATLYEYVLVRRQPMLTIPLRRARPDDPPSYAQLAARLVR